MSILNPDYKKFYGLYKKLPGILAIATAALVFIWSIVDLAVFSYTDSHYGGLWYTYEYGVMGLESWILVLLIWWSIGAIVAASTWFFSVIVVSATVARTDATLAIEKTVSTIKIDAKNEPKTPIAPHTNSQVEIQIVPSPSQVAEQEPQTTIVEPEPQQVPVIVEQPVEPVKQPAKPEIIQPVDQPMHTIVQPIEPAQVVEPEPIPQDTPAVSSMSTQESSIWDDKPAPGAKPCPFCGSMITSRVCEVCGTLNNLFD